MAWTPGEEGKWFATAKQLGLYDIALELANRSPCDPKTLNRAARAHANDRPDFALEVALVSLRWVVAGWGYEITGADVVSAFDCALRAAERLGRTGEVLRRTKEILGGEGPAAEFVRGILARRLELHEG